jgi:hypothetical protein
VPASLVVYLVIPAIASHARPFRSTDVLTSWPLDGLAFWPALVA